MSALESEISAAPSDAQQSDALRRQGSPPSSYGARRAEPRRGRAASYAINIIVQVASVPIFLKFWGKELYGEWLILMAVPAYFAMSDVGFGNIAATEMTMLVAAGNRERALEVFQSTWLLISAVSLALILMTTAIVPAIDFRQLLQITRMTQEDVVSVALLLTAYVLVGQQTLLLGAGYRCEGRNALGVMWSNLARFAEFFALAAGVAAGASVVGAATIMLVVRTVATIAMRLGLRRMAPWLVFGRRHASIDLVRSLTAPAVAFMAFPLGNAMRIQGIVMVIGHILGPVAVVVFSTTRTLTNMAFQMMSMVHLAVWPELSAAFGANDIETARKLHRKACHAAFWLSTGTVCALLLGGRWVYRVWTRGAIEFDAYLFVTMLAVIVVNSLWYTSSAVPMATNTHQRTAGCYFLGTCIAVVMAWILTPRLGLVGGAVSLLAIDVLMLANVVPQSLRLVQDTFGAYVRSVLALPRIEMLSAAMRAFRPRPAAKEVSCE